LCRGPADGNQPINHFRIVASCKQRPESMDCETASCNFYCLKCDDAVLVCVWNMHDRLCGLVVRVLGYRFGGPGSIPGTTRFFEKKQKKRNQVVGLERGPLSLVSTTEELLDKKVAAPV
jgi:hypothetical protein